MASLRWFTVYLVSLAAIQSWLDLVLWMGVVSISVSILLPKGLLLFLSLFYFFSNTFSCKKVFLMLRVLLFLCCLWGNELPSFVSVWWTNIWIKQAKIDSSITSRSPIKKMSDGLYWNLGDPVESCFELGRWSWLFLSLFYSSILVFSYKKCLNAVCEEGNKLPSSVSVL